MTRFDAETPDERRALYTEGIVAQRERGVGFLTVEVEAQHDETAQREPAVETGRESTAEPPVEPPWVQFTAGTLNLDCTDAELDRLADLLGEFPTFTIEERTSPENAAGTNVRVSAVVDDERIAAFIEAAFLQVYACSEAYRAWIATL